MNRKEVLILENNPFDAELISEAVREEGLIPVVFKDVGSALAEVIHRGMEGRDEFRLYILDKNLSGGRNGIDFLRDLRELGIAKPIIVNTGYPQKVDILIARELFVPVFLRKSSNGMLIRKAMELALGGLKGGVVFLEEAKDDSIKYLIPIKLRNGEEGFFEIVSIKDIFSYEDDARTICLSTQTGCLMGCAFCLTGSRVDQYVRNLTFREMYFGIKVAEIFHGFTKDSVHITVSGMGEPLLNLENLETLLEYLDNRHTFRLTTVVPSKKHFQKFVNMLRDNEAVRSKMKQLQISLHFFRDDLRKKHMSVPSSQVSIAEIRQLAEDFFYEFGIETCFNNAIFRQKNDSDLNIEETIKFLKDSPLMLRVSKANVCEDYRPVKMERMIEMRDRYVSAGINCKDIFESRNTQRRGGCGQLMLLE